MIQVDMFEVQLGAALLLQFRTGRGRTVRILADAGVSASGYPVDHVHKKLRGAFREFGDDDEHLDLIIGTHYDADHLDGLVPIIQDEAIKIAEVWLPPVANDSERHAFDEPVADHHLLARQLYSDRSRRVLGLYLNMKEWICRHLRVRGEREDNQRLRESQINEEILADRTLEGVKEVFLGYRSETLQLLGAKDETHADDERFEPKDLSQLSELIDWDRPRRYPWWPDHYWRSDRQDDAVVDELMGWTFPNSITAYNLASIRKSAADDAIIAISLAKVVETLRQRKPQIPIVCHIVPDGRPRRFVWRSGSGRFEGGSRLAARGPEILLLGPSKGLVEKHRNRLPIGSYASVAMAAMIPIKNITPSNQLSYVARFAAEEQRILVVGDAGCVDFKPSQSEPYYRDLLATLRRLHVLQVAHHAGNNAHFYRVLSAAGYSRQRNRSYLLVSHATEDPHRPSREFNLFLEEIRSDLELVRVLFTSQPDFTKVREYTSMIYPAVDQPGRVGDVRLVFSRRRWRVVKHAIGINPPAVKDETEGKVETPASQLTHGARLPSEGQVSAPKRFKINWE